MRKTDLQDLITTVERIRTELHPQLDARFLEAVVRAEEQSPEDDDAALRSIESALRTLVEGRGDS
jgi:hypothetical protein